MKTWGTSERIAVTLGLGALVAALPACGWPYGYDRDLPDAATDPPADSLDTDTSLDSFDGAEQDTTTDVEPEGGPALAGGGVRVLGGGALSSGGLTVREAGIGTTGPVCSGTLCVSGGMEP